MKSSVDVVLAGGFLIVRKLRRVVLVASFVAVALMTILATTAPSQYNEALGDRFVLSSSMSVSRRSQAAVGGLCRVPSRNTINATPITSAMISHEVR